MLVKLTGKSDARNHVLAPLPEPTKCQAAAAADSKDKGLHQHF